MLSAYGWTLQRQQQFEDRCPGLAPARIVEQQRGAYRIVAADGEHAAQVSGRLAYEAAPGELPAVGDWVAIAASSHGPAIVHHVLPRASAFQRKATTGQVQTICANVDVAFLAASLNGDLNLRRLERYLAVAREGRAPPVILLTKADLCDDIEAKRAEIAAIAGGAPVLAVSALTGEGLDSLAPHLSAGRTAALLGSSGVGKSTLVNALAGADLMATRATIDDKRGRHTTTHRELIRLPSGALLLDSPGLRELGVFAADAGLAATFDDVEQVAAACRFRDCRHRGEPGCAVAAALAQGELDPGRWASYQKLQRELAFEERKDNAQARAAHREIWMQRAKAQRARKRFQARRDED